MPVTPSEFRRMAISFPNSIEQEHMHHPDFRVNGRIFATLGYPDEKWGMVKLPPPKQHELVAAHPAAFTPAKGKWGLQGSTTVSLKAVPKGLLREAMESAWETAVQQKPPARSRKRRSPIL